jgi:hypothetical protein
MFRVNVGDKQGWVRCSLRAQSTDAYLLLSRLPLRAPTTNGRDNQSPTSTCFHRACSNNTIPQIPKRFHYTRVPALFAHTILWCRRATAPLRLLLHALSASESDDWITAGPSLRCPSNEPRESIMLVSYKVYFFVPSSRLHSYTCGHILTFPLLGLHESAFHTFSIAHIPSFELCWKPHIHTT